MEDDEVGDETRLNDDLREWSATDDGIVTEFDPVTETVADIVERAVSALSGRARDTLPPPETVVDSDAIDALFDRLPEGGEPDGVVVTFVYAGHLVRVGESQVVVQECGQ